MMNTILLPPPSTSNIFRVHPSSTSIKQQLATFEALHRSFVARLLRVFSRLFVLSCLLSFRWVSFCWFVVHQDLLHSFNWWSLVARECSRMSVVVAKNSCSWDDEEEIKSWAVNDFLDSFAFLSDTSKQPLIATFSPTNKWKQQSHPHPH